MTRNSVHAASSRALCKRTTRLDRVWGEGGIRVSLSVNSISHPNLTGKILEITSKGNFLLFNSAATNTGRVDRAYLDPLSHLTNGCTVDVAAIDFRDVTLTASGRSRRACQALEPGSSSRALFHNAGDEAFEQRLKAAVGSCRGNRLSWLFRRGRPVALTSIVAFLNGVPQFP